MPNRLGVEDIGVVTPIFMRGDVGLDTHIQAMRPVEIRFEHRGGITGEVAFLVILRQPCNVVRFVGEDHADTGPQIAAPIPDDGPIHQGLGRTAQDFAPGQDLPDRTAGQIDDALNERRGLEVGVAFGHFPTGDAAGIRIFVVEVDQQAVPFGRVDGHRDHGEEGIGKIGLLQSLTRVDEKAANTLGCHLGDLPANFVCAQPVIPKPEGIETGWIRHGVLPL